MDRDTAPSMTEIMLNPAKYGFEQCPRCNGYGSSLKEKADQCIRCHGIGLVEKEEK